MTRFPKRRSFRFSVRTLFVAVTVLSVAAMLGSRYLHSRSIQWQRFSRDEIRRENASGHDVLVSFSANWTMTARMSEIMIDTVTVRSLLRVKGVIPMQADCSNMGPEIRKELAALDQASIPLVVIYPASGQQPTIFSGIATAEAVTAALGKL